jgi:hypothetical protein
VALVDWCLSRPSRHGGLLVFWPYVVDRYLAPVLPLAIMALVFGASG